MVSEIRRLRRERQKQHIPAPFIMDSETKEIKENKQEAEPEEILEDVEN